MWLLRMQSDCILCGYIQYHLKGVHEAVFNILYDLVSLECQNLNDKFSTPKINR